MRSEFGLFLQRQQYMREAHQEQVERLSEPKPPHIPNPNQALENGRKITELRGHIERLKGETPNPKRDFDRMGFQLKTWGRVYDRSWEK